MPRTKNFSDAELRCKCGCGKNEMDVDFLIKLQAVRDELDRPMTVTSGYRCPKHNIAISATKSATGPHTTGHAVDIQCSGKEAHSLIELALGYGMSGVGIMQRGDHASRFLHLDDLLEGAGPRPWIWSY